MTEFANRFTRRSGALVLFAGAISACTGPGLEPPFGDSPAPSAGSGGTMVGTGGFVGAAGGELASGGSDSAQSGGAAAPPPLSGGASGGQTSGATGGLLATGGEQVIDVPGSQDGGVWDPDTCVRFEPAPEPCVLVLPPGMLPAAGASMQVTIGEGSARVVVHEVADAQRCAPEGYFLEQSGSDLRVVLCPVSCVVGATALVRAESGCEPAMSVGETDAGE